MPRSSTDTVPTVPSEPGSEINPGAGHRQRLRARFIKGGAEALADYELLELVLFGADARRDMKPLAKALLKRFKNFAGVVSADVHSLREVDGVGDAAIAQIKAIEAASQLLVRTEIMDRPIIGSWDRLIEYCHTRIARSSIELFMVIYLDRKNRLLHDEILQKGSIDHTPVYPREVVRRALELKATAIILVHNHPSGDATPSRADVDMTQEVKQAVASVGISLHDHLVISRTGHKSFKTLGLL
jgi:DNA repair protein RadC